MTEAASPGRLRKALSLLRQRILKRHGDSSLRETLSEAIEEHDPNGPAQDDLGDTERTMLRNVLAFADLRVDDIAVPRADIIAFDASESFDDLVKLTAEAAHSRMPVFRETMDGIIGMVHVKDVFAYLADLGKPRPRIEQLLRSVLFVPPSMRVIDLLARMRASRVHMAIVVDEYGGTDGLVTIEDLVEQIVGEIEDEHDDAAAKLLRKLPGGLYDADARLPLEELQTALKITFFEDSAEGEDIDTLGGLLFYLAGRVPVIGEAISHDSGFKFEIVDGDPRRVTRVRVLPPPPPVSEAA
jgi:CBS domain containing-hemolysin-like protein